jgi:hypothetical protein
MANLLPALAVQPSVIVLLTSDSMLAKQAVLKTLIAKTPKLSDTVVECFEGLPDYNVGSIEDYALSVFEELEQRYPKAEFIYDLTGGSKLMALVLAKVFTGDNFSQLYLNTQNNLLEYVEPPNKPSEKLSALIDAKTYLTANGATWRSALSESDEWREHVLCRKTLTFEFANLLKRHHLDMENFIRQLNSAASDSSNKDKGLHAPEQQLNFIPKVCQPLMQAIADQGMLDWHAHNVKDITFVNEDAVSYLNGGWLEEYFYLVCEQVGLEDSHCSVKFTDTSIRKSDNHNELDGLCAFNNRLLIAECKTAKLGKDQQKDNNILYKIDSIASHIGGQFCTRLLLSALPLDHQTHNKRQVNVTQRAKSIEVRVLAGKDIVTLKDHLQYWKDMGQWKTE